eukprot:SAG31_NODE_466_length_15291_cov_7.540066_9_plen_434_part_00
MAGATASTLRRVSALSAHLNLSAAPARAGADPYGADESGGYPTTAPGWQPRPGQFAIDDRKKTRVANYSGGYEWQYPHRVIRAAQTVSPLSASKYNDEFTYRWGSEMRTVEEFAESFPLTGLLIARRGEVMVEHYFRGREAAMRFQSWSMAKSITSLLLGVCIDRGLISSLDDTAERYVPELRGSYHGSVSLRNLSNMTSGAAIVHASEDYSVLYPRCFTDADSDLAALVAGWNKQAEGIAGQHGRTFNYNELCPLCVGLAIRHATNMSLSEFAEEVFWQKIGAEGDAVWSTDSTGKEFCCVGFGARLRDWARVAQLLAQRGYINGMQVVSEAWIDEITSWNAEEATSCLWARGKHANSTLLFEQGILGVGYKAFFWHHKADGSQPVFSGHNGQMIIVDMPSETVLVMTGVSEEGPWLIELMAIMQAAINYRR